MVRVSSSFRDPSGYIFKENGCLYRSVSMLYKENYEQLMGSGLYNELIEKELLVKHEEVKDISIGAYKTIKPEFINFISYPYEWCFSQYKDAALLTLEIQEIAMKYNMSLKDASAYNIQFFKGKPIFIDTLSFEKLDENKPWVAYKQFCQHFLAPIALMAKKDLRLSGLMMNFIDGIPLDLASTLLPKLSWGLGIFLHIHLHAKSQSKYRNIHDKQVKNIKFSKTNFFNLIKGLKSIINSLEYKSVKTEWGDYYNFTNYELEALNDKKRLVSEYIMTINPKNLWDLGSNNGIFSRIASNHGVNTIAFDIDPIAIEKSYTYQKKHNEKNILPLIMDLTNPSPSIGFANDERDSFIKRGPADTIMALALIHHLAISNNLPFKNIAEFFAEICHHLIIEFISKQDSQVQKLLSTREDIFPNYTEADFRKEFSKIFKITRCDNIKNMSRTLYLMEKK